MDSLSVEVFKDFLNDKPNGIVLDIDETLSATNVAWFERLTKLFGRPPSEEDEDEEEDEKQDKDRQDLRRAPLSTTDQLIRRYHLAQNVPHWNSQPEAMEWMQSQRDSEDAQRGLPLIPRAAEGVAALGTIVPILGYLTVRPVGVVGPTIEWLREGGFPDAPVISRPDGIAFAGGNQWKGRVLNELYPHGVSGIVDDNPKVSIHAGADYPGTLFLFGKSACPEGAEHAIPCETWDDVVEEARNRKDRLNGVALVVDKN